MSLPTCVRVYQSDECIRTVSYNVGWVMDELKLAKDMKMLMNDIPCDFVEVYGIRYDPSTIDEEIMWIEALSENYRFDMRKRSEARRKECEAKGVSTTSFPISTRAIPMLVADQVVGVQPMQESSSKMFTLTVYKHK